jgi:hypothetical protein
VLSDLVPIEVVDLEVVLSGEEPRESGLARARRAAEPENV